MGQLPAGVLTDSSPGAFDGLYERSWLEIKWSDIGTRVMTISINWHLIEPAVAFAQRTGRRMV